MKILRTLSLYLSFLFLVCCTENRNNHFQQQQILGEWVLQDAGQINYPALAFNDIKAILHSRGDTIYYYDYRIRGDTLELDDIHGETHKNRIKTLTQEELVFDNLLEHSTPQVYKRHHGAD
jgi:hypothetical protein